MFQLTTIKMETTVRKITTKIIYIKPHLKNSDGILYLELLQKKFVFIKKKVFRWKVVSIKCCSMKESFDSLHIRLTDFEKKGHWYFWCNTKKTVIKWVEKKKQKNCYRLKQLMRFFDKMFEIQTFLHFSFPELFFWGFFCVLM